MAGSFGYEKNITTSACKWGEILCSQSATTNALAIAAAGTVVAIKYMMEQVEPHNIRFYLKIV
jgi:hypothetical protein